MTKKRAHPTVKEKDRSEGVNTAKTGSECCASRNTAKTGSECCASRNNSNFSLSFFPLSPQRLCGARVLVLVRRGSLTFTLYAAQGRLSFPPCGVQVVLFRAAGFPTITGALEPTRTIGTDPCTRDKNVEFSSDTVHGS
jgi:hypothetical protein